MRRNQVFLLQITLILKFLTITSRHKHTMNDLLIILLSILSYSNLNTSFGSDCSTTLNLRVDALDLYSIIIINIY